MSTKRKSGGQTQSDFKRLKAKVGKRTPKSANLTDTSFKAASLHVTGQSIHRSSSSTKSSDIVLSSARGNTIFDLSTQMSHPAAAVRLSAIKGMCDIARNQPSYLLRPHLSLLVATCAKSWVDEDDEVRDAGLLAFGELLSQHDDSSIKPFILLIVAYFTSALHSLDSQMRVDGAKAVNLVSTIHPSLVRPFVSKLLPPFINLLADRNKLKSSEEILQALVRLLEVSLDFPSKKDRHSVTNVSDDKEPDLTFLVGGRSRNTILLDGRKSMNPIQPFFTLKNLPSFDDLISTDALLLNPESLIASEGETTCELTNILDLLEKLRDNLVETIEEDDTQVTGRKPSSASSKTERLLLLVKAIGLLWKRKTLFCSRKRLLDTEKLDKLAFQTTSIILDLFPLRVGDFKGMEASSTGNLNSAICTTVMDIGSSISPDLFKGCDGNKLDWMKSLASFLLPRLQDYTVDKNHSSSALKVFCELLLLSMNSDDFSQSNRLSMFKQLQAVFFDAEDASMACSSAGRRVALVVVEMMKRLDYCIDEVEPSLKDTLTKIILGLPFYLNAWASDFCFESSEILGMLHSMARSNSIDDEMLQPIQDGVGQLVLAKRKTTGKSKHSIFELYPISIQRQCLALMVMLGQPSSDTLKGLAAICSKATIPAGGVSANIADEIVTSLQVVRRAVSMKDYLTFLLNIIATPPAKTKKKQSDTTESVSLDLQMERLILLDMGIQRASCALIQCGSARVLQMLLSHLSSLLDTKLEVAPTEKYLRMRVAISVLAMLALNVISVGSEFKIPPKLEQSLEESILETLVFISSSDNLMKKRAKLISPIIALCQVDSSLLVALFENVVKNWKEYQSRKSLQNNIIQLLIDIVSDQRLTETISGLARLSDCIQSLEAEPRKELFGHLRALLEIKIGK